LKQAYVNSCTCFHQVSVIALSKAEFNILITIRKSKVNWASLQFYSESQVLFWAYMNWYHFMFGTPLKHFKHLQLTEQYFG